MGKRRNKQAMNAVDRNARVFWHYMQQLKEICCNMYVWDGLPKEIDRRFLELTLYEKSLAIFFFDSEEIRVRADSNSPMMMFNGDTNKYFAVQGAPSGEINMYHNPTYFYAYGPGGFSRRLSIDECVPIWGNFLREPILNSIEIYAQRLADIDRIMEVNLNAQRTPIVMVAPEEMRLTIQTFYDQMSDNQPVIYVPQTTWATLGKDTVQAVETNAPYIVDKLLIDKAKIWGEIMTFLGIDNANQEKRERLVANEVEANNGQVEISRLRGLDARRYACEQINERYGLNVSVNFNYDWISTNFRFEHDLERQSQIAGNDDTEEVEEKEDE